MKTQTFAMKTVTLLTVSVLALVGCKQEDKDKAQESRVRVNANSSQSSDELTLAAEQLVSPSTFMLSYKLAKLAYEKDPKNLKAEFYMRLLERFEAFRGIYTRIRPALNQEQINNLNKHIADFPDSPLKLYLTETGGASINNTKNLQDVLSHYFSSILEFRKFLKENQNSELEIYLNPYVFQDQFQKDQMDSCETIETRTEGSYSISVDCNYQKVATKKLDIGDFIALRQIVSAELIYGVFMNSYSLDGIEKLAEREKEGAMSNQEKTKFLASLPGFGLLNQSNLMGVLKELGSDLSTSLKWAIKYQSSLCPKGYESPNQRRGHLFSKGLCVTSEDGEVERFIKILDQALGGATQIEIAKEGQVIKTKMDIFAWSQNPIKDLRQVMPISWNECDEATALQDNTLGGIFVENNAAQILKNDCQGNE